MKNQSSDKEKEKRMLKESSSQANTPENTLSAPAPLPTKDTSAAQPVVDPELDEWLKMALVAPIDSLDRVWVCSCGYIGHAYANTNRHTAAEHEQGMAAKRKTESLAA